jgi:hypothetical protein
VFEWLFPGWSNPAHVAAFLALRALSNVLLTGLVARSAGRRAPTTLAAGAATVLSAAMAVSVLRPGGLGHAASYAELAVGATPLALAGAAVLRNRSPERLLAYAALCVPTLLLLGANVVLYGEAFVAP